MKKKADVIARGAMSQRKRQRSPDEAIAGLAALPASFVPSAGFEQQQQPKLPENMSPEDQQLVAEMLAAAVDFLGPGDVDFDAAVAAEEAAFALTTPTPSPSRSMSALPAASARPGPQMVRTQSALSARGRGGGGGRGRGTYSASRSGGAPAAKRRKIETKVVSSEADFEREVGAATARSMGLGGESAGFPEGAGGGEGGGSGSGSAGPSPKRTQSLNRVGQPRITCPKSAGPLPRRELQLLPGEHVLSYPFRLKTPASIASLPMDNLPILEFTCVSQQPISLIAMLAEALRNSPSELPKYEIILSSVLRLTERKSEQEQYCRLLHGNPVPRVSAAEVGALIMNVLEVVGGQKLNMVCLVPTVNEETGSQDSTRVFVFAAANARTNPQNKLLCFQVLLNINEPYEYEAVRSRPVPQPKAASAARPMSAAAPAAPAPIPSIGGIEQMDIEGIGAGAGAGAASSGFGTMKPPMQRTVLEATGIRVLVNVLHPTIENDLFFRDVRRGSFGGRLAASASAGAGAPVRSGKEAKES
jgi:hypothetical protein